MQKRTPRKGSTRHEFEKENIEFEFEQQDFLGSCFLRIHLLFEFDRGLLAGDLPGRYDPDSHRGAVSL